MCRSAASRRHAPNPTSRKACEKRYLENGGNGQNDGARRAGAVCSCCTVGARAAIYSEARQRRLTVDHIIPISKGGPHCVYNLQIISLRANCQKAAQYDPMVEGIQYLQNLGIA